MSCLATENNHNFKLHWKPEVMTVLGCKAEWICWTGYVRMDLLGNIFFVRRLRRAQLWFVEVICMNKCARWAALQPRTIITSSYIGNLKLWRFSVARPLIEEIYSRKRIRQIIIEPAAGAKKKKVSEQIHSNISIWADPFGLATENRHNIRFLL